MDIHQLSQALDNYKTEYGEYPPDFVGVNDTNPTVKQYARDAVLRHLRKRFPRFVFPSPSITGGDPFDDFVELVRRATSDNNLNGTGLCINTKPSPQSGEATDGPGLDISHMVPAQALVFWLGGVPTYAGSNELTGFSANQANPFAPSSVVPTRAPRLFEFDVKKLLFYAKKSPSFPASDDFWPFGVSSDVNDPNIEPTYPLAYGSSTTSGKSLAPIAYFRTGGSPYSTTDWYVAAISSWVTYMVNKEQAPTTPLPYADSRSPSQVRCRTSGWNPANRNSFRRDSTATLAPIRPRRRPTCRFSPPAKTFRRNTWITSPV